MATWIKYKNAENITDIFNIDLAQRFRHIEEGDSTFLEVHVNGTVHTIMWMTDKEAFHAIIDYIRNTTGYPLE